MFRPPNCAVLAYDGLCLFEFGIAMELFALARPELGVDWYRCEVVSADPRVRGGAGSLRLSGCGSAARLDQADLIVVPGWKGVDVEPDDQLKHAMLRAHARGAEFLSICSGAFLLGACGLLDGVRASTHWRYAEAFRSRFPLAELDQDVLYVDSGQVITSAGSAAGLDAGLHLIRRHFGAHIAHQVAQRLVLAPQRDGGQRQFIPAPSGRAKVRPVARLQQWVRAHPRLELGVEQLAARLNMSQRSLFRLFADEVGESPARWVLRQRVDLARILLETSRDSLQQIADATGLGGADQMRRVFRQQVGLSPTRYRERFLARS